MGRQGEGDNRTNADAPLLQAGCQLITAFVESSVGERRTIGVDEGWTIPETSRGCTDDGRKVRIGLRIDP